MDSAERLGECKEAAVLASDLHRYLEHSDCPPPLFLEHNDSLGWPYDTLEHFFDHLRAQYRYEMRGVETIRWFLDMELKVYRKIWKEGRICATGEKVSFGRLKDDDEIDSLDVAWLSGWSRQSIQRDAAKGRIKSRRVGRFYLFRVGDIRKAMRWK